MVEEATAGSRFWAFAVNLYPRRAAQAAFLELQDAHGADVPMLLWCLWNGSLGARITDAQMRKAVAFSQNWRRARVDPVRALRRGWKGHPDGAPDALAEAARQEIARAEQAIERLQMNWLAELKVAEAAPAPAHAENLTLYAQIAALDLPDGPCATLRRECSRL